MSSLAQFIAIPRLVEQHHVDVAAPAERAHSLLRRIDLRRSALVRGLVLLRRLPERLRGQVRSESLCLDDLASVRGFRVLVDDATTFAAGTESFDPAGDLALGWEIRCTPLGERSARVVAELRVSAGDEASWRRFERSYRLLGPVSRLVLRNVLDLVVNDFGAAPSPQPARPLEQST
jgi:hypothetical protein